MSPKSFRILRFSNERIAILIFGNRQISHVRRQTHIVELPIFVGLQVVVNLTQIEMCCEVPVAVEFAGSSLPFLRLPDLLTIVPLAVTFFYDSDFSASDRFAKQIFGGHGDIGVLSG